MTDRLVIFEPRIANKKLLSEEARKYSEVHDNFRFVDDKTNTLYTTRADGSYVKCTDDDDPMSPWHKDWCNCYTTWSYYWGNDQIGYNRKIDRLKYQLGMMFDFDSHTTKDDPLERIRDLISSTKLENEVPFKVIKNSGHGFQLHFQFNKPYDVKNPEMLELIVNDYKNRYDALIYYFDIVHGLKADVCCSNPNRLFRMRDTFNTKDLIAFDKDKRLPVTTFKEGSTSKDPIEWMDEIVLAYGSKARDIIEKEEEKLMGTDYETIDEKELANMLNHIKLEKYTGSDGYDMWMGIGMALKNTGLKGSFDLWNNWSKTDATRYSEVEIEKKWNSFKGKVLGNKKYTIGTIVHFAKLEGWIDTSLDPIDIILKKSKPVEIEAQSFSSILKTEYPPLVWLVQDLLPVGFCLFHGKEKIGKSSFILDLAYSISQGKEFIGNETNTSPLPVLYYALEDTGRRIQSRAKKMGLDLTNINDNTLNFIFGTNEIIIPDMNSGFPEMLAKHIEKYNPKMVIIDTYQRVGSNPSAKLDAFQNTYKIGATFQRISQMYDISIVVIHHDKKGKEEDSLDNISGGKGLPASADVIWGLSRAGGDRTSNAGSLEVTGRDVASKKYDIEWSPEKIRYVKMESGGTKEQGELESSIICCLMSGPKTRAELDKALKDSGVTKSKAGISRLLSKLSAELKVKFFYEKNTWDIHKRMSDEIVDTKPLTSNNDEEDIFE
jgi:hypothetical protein